MDITLAQTFLMIADTGSFQAAAERMNVTQSTVSTRIQTLESQLGQTLFLRGRHGAQTTAAGRRFRVYAERMARLWEQARHEVALPDVFVSSVSVGGQVSLWDRVLPPWLRWMRERAPDVALRIEAGSAEEAIRQIAEGQTALAILYTPQHRPSFMVEPLFDDVQILVQAGDGAAGPGTPGYVFVDWGPDFLATHAEAWPEFEAPAVFVRIGTLGLQHILVNGGSGYFPERAVKPFVAAGRLAVVEDAPSFRRSSYLVCGAARSEPAVALAREGLLAVAAEL